MFTVLFQNEELLKSDLLHFIMIGPLDLDQRTISYIKRFSLLLKDEYK